MADLQVWPGYAAATYLGHWHGCSYDNWHAETYPCWALDFNSHLGNPAGDVGGSVLSRGTMTMFVPVGVYVRKVSRIATYDTVQVQFIEGGAASYVYDFMHITPIGTITSAWTLLDTRTSSGQFAKTIGSIAPEAASKVKPHLHMDAHAGAGSGPGTPTRNLAAWANAKSDSHAELAWPGTNTWVFSEAF